MLCASTCWAYFQGQRWCVCIWGSFYLFAYTVPLWLLNLHDLCCFSCWERWESKQDGKLSQCFLMAHGLSQSLRKVNLSSCCIIFRRMQTQNKSNLNANEPTNRYMHTKHGNCKKKTNKINYHQNKYVSEIKTWEFTRDLLAIVTPIRMTRF